MPLDADLQLIQDYVDTNYTSNHQQFITGPIGNSALTQVLTGIQESRDQNQAGFEVVTKSGHSFTKSDVVYLNGTNWTKAKANNVLSLGYFIISATDGDDFTVQNIGLISGLSGLTAGAMYYVSQATSGAMTITKPSSGYANPIFYAISDTKGFVMPFLADIDFDNINGIPTEVDETDTDAAKNKLVSNALAKDWEDHKDTTSGNPHSVTKSEVGLGSVTNDAQIPLAQKGAASGVAELDGTGKVPSAQLPSYVDDVKEYANLAAFPGTGEAGKIYIALDTNKTYRWGGSAYIDISDGTDVDAIHDNVAGEIAAITEKTTPVDADIILIEDSAASNAKKKLSWTNIKATLKTYFDSLYAPIATSQSVASSATPSPIGSSRENEYYLTALAANATFAAPSGTPVNGNTLFIRIEDNGTARTLAWNAIYRLMSEALPTTTVLGKILYIGFAYNSADSKWDCIGINQEG